MSTNQPDLPRSVARMLHEHWILFLVEGIVLLVLGVAAVLIPPLAMLAVAIFLGWLFLISGIVGLVITFWMRGAPGFGWSVLSGLLGIAAGVVLIGWPVGGALSLVLVLIVYFLIEGVASIMFALEHRRALSGRWGWMLASGVVDLVLGGVILAGLPDAAFWIIGLLVGINLLFGGVSLIAMALHARRIG